MRFWTAYAVLALSLASRAMAAGNGHHGSVSDLIAPAFNVAVLAGFLIWKLKGPLKNHFNSQADEVASTLERADLKSKEAEVMLTSQSAKMANLANEVKSIHTQSESDVVTFKKTFLKKLKINHTNLRQMLTTRSKLIKKLLWMS